MTRLADMAGAAIAVALFLASAGISRAADLREGFQAALPLRAPLRALEAERAVALARRERAEGLTPGAPVLSLGYRTNQVFRDRGLREVEAEAGVPLWLPGEGRALRTVAEAQLTQIDARIARERLVTAGEVRAAWWSWATAARVREALQARVASASGLERDASRQADAGNVPASDRLAAVAALREAQAALRAQDLAVQRAAIAFRTLTGLNPSPGPEEQPAAAAALEDPRALAARALVESGRAAERLVALRTRTNPELGFQLRHERDAFGEPWGSRAALLLTIPLPNPSAQRERLAEARAAVAAGTAELATLDRTLRAALDRAREVREAALARAASAEARHAALAEQVRLFDAAWRAGQLPLIEVARVRMQVAEADASRRQARAEAGRAVSAMNQALGIEPR